jgi:hypothetical protein
MIAIKKNGKQRRRVKMKRVYKYGTGQAVPEGAIYLSTVVEEHNPNNDIHDAQYRRFVWHYFLVEDTDSIRPSGGN